MFWWIESQQTPVIALIVFAFSYLLAALVLFGLTVLSRSPIAGALHVTTPAMLTPLAVILGLGQYGNLLDRRGLLRCPTDDQ